MPLKKLAFFLAEIGPLQAEEKLTMLNALRLSQAGKDDNQAKMIQIGWENEANRTDRIIHEEAPKPSKAEYFAMIGRMGLLKA